MEVSTNKSESLFRPVCLNIIFTSKDELDAFSALMNYTPVSNAMSLTSGYLDTYQISKHLESEGADISRSVDDIHRVVLEHPAINSQLDSTCKTNF